MGNLLVKTRAKKSAELKRFDFDRRRVEKSKREITLSDEEIERIKNNILAGRKVKPCGKETRELGLIIAEMFDHSSFVNFPNLMDDEEFILQALKITPNPIMCENYLLKYVNPYLKQKADFMGDCLIMIFKNENIYNLETINYVVSEFGFEEHMAKFKPVLREIVSARLMKVQTFPKLEERSGDNKTSKQYHAKKLELVDLNRIKAEGLTKILESLKEKEKFYFDEI